MLVLKLVVSIIPNRTLSRLPLGMMSRINNQQWDVIQYICFMEFNLEISSVASAKSRLPV